MCEVRMCEGCAADCEEAHDAGGCCDADGDAEISTLVTGTGAIVMRARARVGVCVCMCVCVWKEVGDRMCTRYVCKM